MSSTSNESIEGAIKELMKKRGTVAIKGNRNKLKIVHIVQKLKDIEKTVNAPKKISECYSNLFKQDEIKTTLITHHSTPIPSPSPSPTLMNINNNIVDSAFYFIFSDDNENIP